MSSQPVDVWLRDFTPEQLETLLDALGEGIVALDTDGRVVGMNRAACRMLESDKAQARTKPCRSLFGEALAGRLGGICQALHHARPTEEVRWEWTSPSGVRRVLRFLGATSFEAPERGRFALLVLQDETAAAGLGPEFSQLRGEPSEPRVPTPAPATSGNLQDEQREVLCRTLEATGWNVAKASRRLKISRTTIYERIRRFGLARPPE